MPKKKSVSPLWLLCALLLVSAGLFMSCTEPVASVAKPTSSIAAGTYVGAREVVLSSTTEDASIYYTLDGSTPTTASNLYDQGFLVEVSSSPTTLKALAIKEGMKNSVIASIEYEILQYGIQPTVAGTSGGYIFYDKGTRSEGWRYLEAALNDVTVGETIVFKFGFHRHLEAGSPVLVGTSKDIGAGQVNTTALVSAMGPKAYESHLPENILKIQYAAQLCDSFVAGAYSDWFLPSKEELTEMHTNLKKNELSDFFWYYWSSSEGTNAPATVALGYNFSNNGFFSAGKSHLAKVRPARAF